MYARLSNRFGLLLLDMVILVIVGVICLMSPSETDRDISGGIFNECKSVVSTFVNDYLY